MADKENPVAMQAYDYRGFVIVEMPSRKCLVHHRNATNGPGNLAHEASSLADAKNWIDFYMD